MPRGDEDARKEKGLRLQALFSCVRLMPNDTPNAAHQDAPNAAPNAAHKDAPNAVH